MPYNRWRNLCISLLLQNYECITHDNDGTPWCATGKGAYQRYWANKTGSCMPDCPGKFMLTILCNHNNAKYLFS